MKIDELEALGPRLDAMAREHALTRWVGTATFGAFVLYHLLRERAPAR